MAKALPLVKAYMNEQIPSEGGFIISAFFDPESVYAIYEVTAYRNVKDIFRMDEGIMFKTDGNRTHMLVEPASYSHKSTEPVGRDTGRSIPYRFKEVDILTGKKSEKIMVAKEPMFIHSSFTILEKQGDYFSFVFFPTNDVYIAIKKFLADSLYNDCNMDRESAKKASEALLKTIKKFSIWGK